MRRESDPRWTSARAAVANRTFLTVGPRQSPSVYPSVERQRKASRDHARREQTLNGGFRLDVLSTPSTAEVALGIDQKEFRETKGRSVSGRLVEIDRIGDYYKYMKGWSKFIVDHFWPEQGTLFN